MRARGLDGLLVQGANNLTGIGGNFRWFTGISAAGSYPPTVVFPVDGLFDSKTETFRFKTDALRPGTHVLVLRVRNAAGTFGSGDVVINKD